MSDQKISALLAFSLLSLPLSLPATAPLQGQSAASNVSSQRASVRRMKEQLALVQLDKSFYGYFCVKAPRIDDRKSSRIELILLLLRSSILGSFHARNNRKNFCQAVLAPVLLPMGTYVGELQEKWRFPSDHLPIGMTFEDLQIASWNVLDAKYMDWVMEKDSQGLKRSMIGEEHVLIENSKLTVRDRHVVDLILGMLSHPTHPRAILSLQECGKPFLEELQSRLPAHFELISHHGDAVLLDKSRFAVIDAREVAGIFSDAPHRTLQDIRIRRLNNGQTLRLVNVHLPGDPEKPGRAEFAAYLKQTFDPAVTTLAMGDMNFNELEMTEALGQSPFSLHSPYPTDIAPFEFKSKAIDHFIVYSPNRSSVILNKPEEVMAGVDAMVALLKGEPQPMTARVVSSPYEEETGSDKLYQLDSGMLLSFRWYADPNFSAGDEISWVKQGNGILVSYEGGSVWLRGDFEMNSFTMP